MFSVVSNAVYSLSRGCGAVPQTCGSDEGMSSPSAASLPELSEATSSL